MNLVAVLSCAAVAAVAAWALTGFMRHCATSEAPILTRWFHVIVAAALGALAGLANSWAEMVAFVVLAVAAGLLTVIDFAEERLPDLIVLPLLGITAVLFTLAAWTTGNWTSLARAGIAAVAGFVLYFVMMVFSPDLGFGDVKLAAVVGVVGGWFGWIQAVLCLFFGWALFGVFAMVVLARKKGERKGSLPFGPFLILGTVIGLFWPVVPAVA